MIFLLDSSGSVGRDNFELLKQFVISVTSSFVIGPNDTQVGVIVFSNRVRVEFPLNQYSDEASLHEAIQNILFIGGDRDTAAGLSALKNEGFTAAGGIREKERVPKVAIVVIAGFSNSFEATVTAARSVHAANIIVYAIGVGGFNIAELQAIATTSQNVYSISSFDIRGIQQPLMEGACRSKCLYLCVCVCVRVCVCALCVLGICGVFMCS